MRQGSYISSHSVVIFAIGAQTHNDGSLGAFLYVLGCSIAVREAEPIVGNTRLFRERSFPSINRFPPKEMWLMGSRVARHGGAREGIKVDQGVRSKDIYMEEDICVVVNFI